MIAAHIAVQTASVFLIQNVPYWVIAKCTEAIWHFILIITGHCVPKSVCGSVAECEQKIQILLLQHFLQQQ